MSDTESANESRRRRTLSGQGMLVATESFEAEGARFFRGESRIAFRHALLQNRDIRRRFVACESPAGRAVIRSGPTPWRLRSRQGDRPQWWLAAEEVR
jgi:hypothetical protein